MLWVPFLVSTIVPVVSRRALLRTSATTLVAPTDSRVYNAPRPLRFYGEVNAASCDSLVQALLEEDVSLGDTVQPISLHIQSLGGELMPLMYVLDCMDELRHPVWTYVDGYAASAASLLSVYGKRRFMTKRSFILLHELRTSVQGPYTSVATDLHHARELMAMMCEVYEKRTRMSREAIDRLLTRDVWLNAKTCLELGVVDGIL